MKLPVSSYHCAVLKFSRFNFVFFGFFFYLRKNLPALLDGPLFSSVNHYF